jgi:hypothetical protein
MGNNCFTVLYHADLAMMWAFVAGCCAGALVARLALRTRATGGNNVGTE